MAVLGVRVMGSSHYRNEKFRVWARGSPETLTFLFGVTPVFLTILVFLSSPLLDGRLLACKAAAYFMWHGSSKANDANGTEYNFYGRKSRRAVFFNKSATKSRALIFG